MPVNSLLNASAWIATHASLIFGIVAAIILVAAFFIGCVKGVRKVSWGGVILLVVGVLFFVGSWLLKDSILVRLMEQWFSPQVSRLILNLSLLIVCTLLALITHGVLAAKFRLKRTHGKEEEIFNPNGYQYNPNISKKYLFPPYNPENDNSKVGTLKKAEPPHVLSRIFGGFICLLNTALVLSAILSMVLLLINGTQMISWNIGSFMKSESAQIITNFALKYGIDFITIGILVAFAILGFRKGFLRSLRLFVIVGGIFAAIMFGFGLPFYRKADEWHFFTVFITRCQTAITPITSRLDEVGGRLLAGVVLCAIFLIFVGVLGVLTSLLVKKVEGNVVNYGFDGIMGSVFMLLLGALLVLAFWAIAFAFNAFGILHVRDVLTKGATLSNSIYESMEVYIEPLIRKFGQLVGGAA